MRGAGRHRRSVCVVASGSCEAAGPRRCWSCGGRGCKLHKRGTGQAGSQGGQTAASPARSARAYPLICSMTTSICFLPPLPLEGPGWWRGCIVIRLITQSRATGMVRCTWLVHDVTNKSGHRRWTGRRHPVQWPAAPRRSGAPSERSAQHMASWAHRHRRRRGAAVRHTRAVRNRRMRHAGPSER
jgi:hypothetical protein